MDLSNTVDGKLIAIPQEVVAYGLFVNKDMFDQYQLSLPETPEKFLKCCQTFKENGVETPIGANRWWLETFVFAQAYADLYNGGNTEAEITALNSGEARYSDYMRPGFEFLQTLIDEGYIDAEKALVSEAIEAERPDFLAGKTSYDADWDRVRYEMMLRFGYYITESSEHSAEYTPWFIKEKYPELIERYKIPLDEYPRRCIKQIEDWKKMRGELVNNEKLEHEKSREFASFIINAMENDVPYRIHGNVLNHGIIP